MSVTHGHIFLLLSMMLTASTSLDCPSECQCNNNLQEVKCNGGKIKDIASKMGDRLHSLSLIGVSGLDSLGETSLQQLKIKEVNRLAIVSSSVKVIQPGAFSNMSTLEDLNLSHNEIHRANSESFNNLTHLLSLNMSHNGLSIIGDSLAVLTNLTHLDLSHNALQKLPAGVFSTLGELTVLNLTGNPLKRLSSQSFQGPLKLQELYARDCSLSSIDPNILGQLTRLNLIDLGHNKLTFMPPPRTLSKAVSLKTLLLDNNSFNNIKKGMFAALRLQVLNFAANHITTIDDSAFQGMTLIELDLSNNKLYSLNTAVLSQQAGTLTHLNLAGNHYIELESHLFDNLQLLVSLNLSGCGLDSMESDMLKNLPKLRSLDISKNNLHYLPESVLLIFNKLDSLRLHDNSWVCDCQIEALRDWLQQKNSAAKHQCHMNGITQGLCREPTCEAPSDLSTVKVSALQDEQLSGCKSSSSLPTGTQGAIVASCMGFAIILLMITIYLWKRGQTANGIKRLCVPSHAESSHSADEDAKVPPLENCDRTSLTISDHNFVFRHYFDHLVTDPKLMSKTSDSEEEGDEGEEPSGRKEKDSLYSSQPSLYIEPPVAAAYGMESTV